MDKQEILNEIEKMENKLADFKQELTKTEKEWIPRYTERYWYYDKDVEEIENITWINDIADKTRLKNKVIFKTEAEAQRYADYQKAKEEYSYKFNIDEWQDNRTYKYFIYYNYLEDKLEIEGLSYCNYMTSFIYFKTSEQAQEFIDKYKAEILEYEFGIKE